MSTLQDVRACFRFPYLRWALLAGLVLLMGIAVASRFAGKLDMLYMENGPLENMSLALWILASFGAAAAYRRWTGALDRAAAFWLAAISCLAFLREADAHILLNPVVLGKYSIHYRIDWILDPAVSILPKLALAGLAVLIGILVFLPLRRLAAPFWKLAIGGDAALGLMVLAVAGQVLGFTLDDLLRGSPLLTVAIRQLSEETCEFLGVCAFFAGIMLIVKTPVSERLLRVSIKPGEAP